nr:glutathione S-transferase C-terminal domain-containing protein [Lujinxingiaceae bacterium]
VHHFMDKDGWTFVAEDGATGDTLHGLDFLHQIYTGADPDYSGRVTVPVLWDSREQTIVSNESSEIIRMLNSAFDEWGDASLDFYPQALRGEIDAVNALVYPAINNGVYRAGFATKQHAYEEAVYELFESLTQYEQLLSKQRFLCGDVLSEADIAMFPTLLRFDAVYYSHFKCNVRRIIDYPNLWNYLKDIYQIEGVAETCNLDHIKHHYYASHENINPTRIVPVGPAIRFDEPHDRDRFNKK